MALCERDLDDPATASSSVDGAALKSGDVGGASRKVGAGGKEFVLKGAGGLRAGGRGEPELKWTCHRRFVVKWHVYVAQRKGLLLTSKINLHDNFRLPHDLPPCVDVLGLPIAVAAPWRGRRLHSRGPCEEISKNKGVLY